LIWVMRVWRVLRKGRKEHHGKKISGGDLLCDPPGGPPLLQKKRKGARQRVYVCKKTVRYCVCGKKKKKKKIKKNMTGLDVHLRIQKTTKEKRT